MQYMLIQISRNLQNS